MLPLTSLHALVLVAVLVVPSAPTRTAQLAIDKPNAPSTNVERTTSATRKAHERILESLGSDLAPSDRDRVSTAISGLDEFLALLPLDRLAKSTLDQGELELRFDFEGASTRKVKIPSQRSFVLESDDVTDPLRTGHAIAVDSATRTLIVRSSLRIKLARDGIESIGDGDLRIAWGFFDFDLTLHTMRSPGRVAHDDKGRIVLATDELGQPLRAGDRFVPRTHDLWVVLAAAGRRVEIGIDPEPRTRGAG